MYNDDEDIKKLSPDEKNKLLDQAEKLALVDAINPEQVLNETEANELAAAAYILLSMVNRSLFDSNKMFSWFKKAADANDVLGMRGLGVCYMQGYGTPTQDKGVNDKAAFELWTKAVAAGAKDIFTLFTLARFYLDGRATPIQDKGVNDKAALKLITEALKIEPGYKGFIEIQTSLQPQKAAVAIAVNPSLNLHHPNMQPTFFSSRAAPSSSSTPAPAAASSSPVPTPDRDAAAFIASLQQTIKAQQLTIETQQQRLQLLQTANDPNKRKLSNATEDDAEHATKRYKAI